ncbi:MAG: hydantoinase/oxoprolinase family protein [Gemmatimonadetes bacterium]|nr:hydantoinase/oxoprolinase family protein [Gemmatimonadota bacterium]
MTRLGVDIGGTFTDLVALEPGGGVRVVKVPSTPEDSAVGLWRAVDRLGEGSAAGTIDALIHGTTVATNALLERRGAGLALLITAGFEDLPWLRRQDRAALYDLARDHPPPLVERQSVIGVAERIGAGGVVRALVPAEIERVVREVAARRPAAVALCLLFSFADPRHERLLAAALREALPGTPVVASHELLPVFREYERASTTTVEAYLRPLVGAYIERVAGEAARRGVPEFRVMASHGGTLAARQARERASALALSGPVGGVEGARLVGTQVGRHDLLTIDMGGTSADASIILGGEPLVQSAGDVGGIPVALPHVLIETVGAGGGSIAWVDQGGALRVGPQSAGAVPGPACYGLGGHDATVTDAALVLGWLDAAHPLAADLCLHAGLAREAVARVAQAAGLDVERCAAGIIEIGTATMVRALRSVSVERGVDPRNTSLVAFGGAGPLFVCRLADSLGVRHALIPPHPGALSALGLAAAKARVELTASLHRRAADLDEKGMQQAYADLEMRCRAELPGGELRRVAECRYPGQGYEVAVPAGTGGTATAAAFHRAHRARFGHADERRPVEIVNIRVIAAGVAATVELAGRGGPGERGEPGRAVRGGRAPLDDLTVGSTLEGPLMLDGGDATGRIEGGWRGVVHETGAVLLQRA